MVLVMRYIEVTDDGSSRRSGTFFCEMMHTESLPRTPTQVIPQFLTALNAYSIWYRRPSGENTANKKDIRASEKGWTNECTRDGAVKAGR